MTTGTTTGGTRARVFVQQDCGKPWRAIGCIGLTGLELDPVQLRYEICVSKDMRPVTTIINQFADPRPFTLTTNASDAPTRKRVMSLHNRTKNGCKFNILLAQLECDDPNSAGDPYASDTWLVLYGNYRAASLNFGNNTYLSLDAKNATSFELQTAYAFTNYAFHAKQRYSRYATVDVGVGLDTEVTSFAFLDNGACADGGCRKCGGVGCQIIYVHTNVGFWISLDGGATWNAQGAAAAVGHAQSFDGKLFRVTPTGISVSIDGSTWTVAITDVAFAGLTNIVKLDVNSYVVGGADSAVWKSVDGGANWTQIRAADATQADWVRMCYDHNSERLWAVGPDAAAANTSIDYSDDLGYTWTVAATAALETKPDIFCTGHATFFVITQKLYKTVCDANGLTVDVEEIAVAGTNNNITGIGSCDPDDCDWLYITTSDEDIFMSLDGGNSWKIEVLPASLSLTGSADLNPVGCCHGANGDRPVFAFGLDLVATDPLDSFFD